jgi:tripartite-type tricarboxylate transporter receptor subunit TctC
MKKTKSRFIRLLGVFAAAGLLGLVLSGGLALADKYPSKKIELVVAFEPGGDSDTFGRAVAQYGEKYVGQTIFVTNRTGGAGAIGFNYGAKAKPDGYVLTLAVTTLTIAPHITKGYPVTIKDYEPLALLSVVPSCISVPKDSKYKDIKDVIKDAKARPGKVRLGTAGTGSPWHLSGAALGKAAGVNLSFVPYKGAGPAITALMGNHIDTVITSAAEIYPHVQSGKLRSLAMVADKRFPAMPNVPTTVEMGIAADVVAWRGVVAPKGTPKPIVDHLIAAITKMSKDPDFLKFMKSIGVDIDLVAGDAFGKWMAKKDKDYGELAKMAGLAK